MSCCSWECNGQQQKGVSRYRATKVLVCKRGINIHSFLTEGNIQSFHVTFYDMTSNQWWRNAAEYLAKKQIL